jgi:hypothetical protein
MESSSKMYNQKENWRGYDIHDPEIRGLISKTNEALGLNDEYNGWSREGEHFRYPPPPPEIKLPEVNTVDEFLVQFSDRLDFANAWLGPDYANRFDALIEEMADEQDIALDGSPEVIKGNIDWNNVTNDLFNGPTGEQINFDLFMKVINLYPYASDSLVQAADRIVDSPEAEGFRHQDNLNAYKEWRQLHSHPYTGQYMFPLEYDNNDYNKKDYERLRELYQKNPWAKQLPPWEEFISEWGGKLPASFDPQYLQENPAKEPSPHFEGMDKDILLPDSSDPRVQNREIERRQRVYEEPSGQLFLAKTATDPALHFNTKTGEPCYCGFGQSRQAQRLVREANLNYKDIKRGEIPKWMDEDEAQQLQKFLIAIVEGGTGYRATPGIKKMVPWLIQQLKNKMLRFDNGLRDDESFSRDPSFVVLDQGSKRGHRLNFDQLEQIGNFFNAEDSPYRLELSECRACDGAGDELTDDGARAMCQECQGWGNNPTGNKKTDLNQLSPSEILERVERHQDWIREKEAIAENKERVKGQEVTHQFDNGWYVTILNPSAEEAEWEGIAQGNCFQSDMQPYKKAVAEGRLTVYVLRDKDGRGHALWAYDLNGNIAVMEDCSKMYNTPGSGWEGYRVNNQWIRDMISNANQAMGLDDTYSEYSHDFEEPEEQYEAEYQLHRVDTIEELFEQYEENADLFDLALTQIDNFNDDVNINEFTAISLGEVNWRDIANDFFNERRDLLENLTILNDITAIAQKQDGDFFDNFVTAFDQEAQSYASSEEAKKGEDPEVEAWKQWEALHTNPFTGEIQFPRDAFEYGYPPRTPEPLTDTGWEFEHPTGEQVTQWGGVMPASVDPLLKRGEPVREMIKCIHCDGTGKSKLWDGMCGMCKGEGVIEAGVSFPSIEKRREIREEGLTNAPAPAAWLREDPATGQFFFSKKKKWDMSISFADQLKNYVASIEPKLSHSLSWVKGGKGRGLMLNDGTLITWPVDKKGNPQHPDMYEYLTGEKLPPAFLPEHFTEGTPFDIDENGALAFFSNDVPADLVSDLSKIDYRLKVSKVAANDYDMYDFHFNCNTGKKCFCRYDGISKRDQILRRREASQTVRKVKNQNQKFLQNEKGDAILDFLHRLISGHGIDEHGEFGQGQFPGLEKMVPWIIKQIKTGYIRPEFDPDGKITRMRYFYANEEAAKLDAGKVLQGDTIYVYLGPPGIHHNELREAVERKKGYNFKINTESPEEAKVAVINAHEISYEEVVKLIESLPGQIETIYMVTPLLDAYEDEDRWKQLPERYRDVTIDLMSPTRSNVVVQALSSAGRASLNENPDISRVPLSAVEDENFMTIAWSDWSDWFNAPNSPARRSRSEKEIRGAINRGIKRAQYLNERHNQDIDLTPTYTNDQLIGIIAEELGVEYSELKRNWIDIERDGKGDESLNDIIEYFVKVYNRNIDQMNTRDVENASRQHATYIAELEKRERLIKEFAATKDSGVVYRITDPAHKGWTVHQIKDREEAELESQAMGHCIGNEEQPYAYSIDQGDIEAFSLRDEDGLPKLTWHYNPDGTLGAIQGKSNNAMPQFRHMVTEFNMATNNDDDDGGSGHEDPLPGQALGYFRLPDPDTIGEYVQQVFESYDAAQEAAEYENEEIDENTEIERGDPDWDQIAEDFIGLIDLEGRNNKRIVGNFFDALIYDNEMDAFIKAAYECIEYNGYEVEDYPIIDSIKLWGAMNYDQQAKRVKNPRAFHTRSHYDEFVEGIREAYGDQVADKLPAWDDLSPSYQGARYLPTSLIPSENQSEQPRPDACPTCNGKGYNYAVGQNISEARLCPTCNGEGMAEYTEEAMPQELWQFNAPVAETPIETADWSMLNQVVCDNCQGQGKVVLPKPRPWYPDEYRQCPECGGDGHKTAKISLKEKAAAWDLPAHKMSKLQTRYINGEL